jgi:phosphatidylglycerol lysyltransferase
MKLPKLGTKRLLVLALQVLPALFFLAALSILLEEIRKIDGQHLWARFATIGPGQWMLAVLATIGGYVVLTFYDVVGLRVVGHKLPYRVAAKGAFLSFTISNNVGFSWISGGSMRQRVYGAMGVPFAEVARLTVFNSLTFFIGAFLLLGAILIGEPAVLAPLVRLAPVTTRSIGAGLWLLIIIYLLICTLRRQPLGWGKVSLPVPRPVTALTQIALSTADISLAALPLYLLLPPDLGISFQWLLGVYVIALAGSVLTHVPGGLGVLETLILWGLPEAPRAPLLAALLAYRIAYYFLPLATALLLIVTETMARNGATAARAVRRTRQFVPVVAAGLTLLSGSLLLVSGATPALDTRISLLRSFVPLPLLELSHLAGSLVGLGLLVLANALYRRYDSARQLAILLLLAGALATLLDGSGLGQALALAAVAAVLAFGAAAFHRRGSLSKNAVSPEWLLLSLVIIGLSILVGFDAYSNVAYRSEFWWQFAYDGNAPRFLRASLVVSSLGIALLLARLLGPSRPELTAEAPNSQIRAIVTASPQAISNLALLGDKCFLASRSGKSFVMYRIEGRSWIAMGDAIGERCEEMELVWRFREMADVAGGRPVFYEVSGDRLDLYADAGLVAHKIGEEARVDLRKFVLDGSAAKSFRADLRRGERNGLTFEIVGRSEIAALLPQLSAVSETWLAARGASEKCFSMGGFDPTYMQEFDCAVVRHEGRIVAFANLWFGAAHEASMDLMRYRPDGPKGTMMFLILKLMLWARQSGFRWFNLGMAPLAGLSPHRLAPKWHLIGRIIFSHGERLYGFGGLRQFKAQFRPVWRSRYVVCPPGALTLALALADCVRLISRAPTTIRPCGLQPDPDRLDAETVPSWRRNIAGALHECTEI